MRGVVLAPVVALLVVASSVGAVSLREVVPADANVAALAKWGVSLDALPVAFPDDFSDAALVFLLAQVAGHEVRVPEPVRVPAGVSVPGMVLHLAQRAGTASELAPEDLVPLAGLDPAVSAPVLALLVAIDEAWTLREQAVAKLSIAERAELAQVGAVATPRQLELAAQVDMQPMLEAAILLLDTLESVAIPALQAAFDAGLWPAVPVADPAGVLRLGGGGADHETTERILHIDPAGNDLHETNMGGTRVEQNVGDPGFLAPISIGLDLAGDDTYDYRPVTHGHYPQASLGSGHLGIGILHDLQGNDDYACDIYCNAYANRGVGYLRDHAGDDSYYVGAYGLAVAILDGQGIHRDDAGNDERLVGVGTGAHTSSNQGSHHAEVALLWDRDGQDSYDLLTNNPGNYGIAEGGARAWLVDEGTQLDYYATGDPSRVGTTWQHGCNDCEWQIHEDAPGLDGHYRTRGVDNYGGLAYVLARDISTTTG